MLKKSGLLNNMACELSHYLIKAKSPNLQLISGSWPNASWRCLLLFSLEIRLYCWVTQRTSSTDEKSTFLSQQYRKLEPPVLCIVGELAGGGSMAVAVSASDMWHVAHDMWHVTTDMWHLTPGTWHLTPNMWHLL